VNTPVFIFSSNSSNPSAKRRKERGKREKRVTPQGPRGKGGFHFPPLLGRERKVINLVIRGGRKRIAISNRNPIAAVRKEGGKGKWRRIPREGKKKKKEGIFLFTSSLSRLAGEEEEKRKGGRGGAVQEEKEGGGLNAYSFSFPVRRSWGRRGRGGGKGKTTLRRDPRKEKKNEKAPQSPKVLCGERRGRKKEGEVACVFFFFSGGKEKGRRAFYTFFLSAL